MTSSRDLGRGRYQFKVWGDDGIVFDYVVEAYFSSEATSQVRALFGHRVIALQDVQPIG